MEGLEWIHYQSYETGSGGYRSQAIGKVDYGNWAMNAYYKATGDQFEYFPVHVVAAPDGNHYLFATEDEALTAQAGDFNPETRHTLEGVQVLFNTTDALGMALTGAVAKGKTPKTNTKPLKGAANPKVKASIEAGKKAHKDIQGKAAKKGWGVEVPMKDPQTGKSVRADLVTRGGHPVEIKPNTSSGRAKGKKQLPHYERSTGKKGRVIYYDPKKYKTNN